MAGLVPRVYSVRHGYRQRVRPLILVTAAATLAGCGSMAQVAGDAELTTGSIVATRTAGAASAVPTGAAQPSPTPQPSAKPASRDGEAPSDWEAVKRSVAKAAVTRKPARIAWSNAETGNSGTISDVIASARQGQNCRNFNTTVASIDGVRLYRAEVCKDAGERWDYVTLEPADRKAAGRDPG